MQGVAVAVGWDQVTEQGGQDDAIGGLAGGAEQQHLLVQGGSISFALGASEWR